MDILQQLGQTLGMLVQVALVVISMVTVLTVMLWSTFVLRTAWRHVCGWLDSGVEELRHRRQGNTAVLQMMHSLVHPWR